MSEPILSRSTPWTTVILVCGKCSRKLDGGYGPKRRDSLRTVLNDALRAVGARRRVRVVESKCFGICPKKAVMALNASRPSSLLTVRRGTPAGEALEELTGIADAAPTAS